VAAGQDGREQGAAGLPAPAYAGITAPGVPLPQGVPDWVFTSNNPLEAAERAILLEAIQRCRWNFSAAAELLKVGRSTLHAKARKFGITRE
jgi:transcriptional regulator of acetoin/glycerol metabolism